MAFLIALWLCFVTTSARQRLDEAETNVGTVYTQNILHIIFVDVFFVIAIIAIAVIITCMWAGLVNNVV